MTLSKKERTRRIIRGQAIRLTVERGFDGFTMHDLAVAWGLSRSSIFNHFSDKVGAVLGVTVDNDVRVGEELALAMALPRARTPIEDAAQMVGAILSELELDRDAKHTQLLMLRAIENEPKLTKAFSKANEEISAWVGRNVEVRFAGEVSEADGVLVATTVMALLSAAITRFISTADSSSDLAYTLNAMAADLARLARPTER